MDYKAAIKLVREHSPEWDLHHRSGDNTMFCFQRTFEYPGGEVGVVLYVSQGREWQARLVYMPGDQMMVRLETDKFSWPNRNFPMFLRRFLHYAVRCAS